MCDGEFGVGFFAGIGSLCFIGGIIFGLLGQEGYLDDEDEIIESLGGAICEQEYNLTLDYYNKIDEKLYCKHVEEHYDGLKVNIGGK